MRTDQLATRLWLTAKVYWLRLRWALLRTVTYAGLAAALLGGYAFLSRYWPRLDALWTIPPPIGHHWLVTEYMGNVVLIAAGAAAVWMTTKTHQVH